MPAGPAPPDTAHNGTVRSLRRIVLIAFLSLSVLATITLAALWIRLLPSPGSSYMIALGRGRHVVELRISHAACSAMIERYDRPLAHYHPDAPLIRTRNHYGWFVDNYREFESEDIFRRGFRFRFTECDYELTTVVFQTTWMIEAPNAFVLAVCALPTAAAFARRWLRRRRIGARGFAVTPSRSPLLASK
jgi:hypothetical protein